MGLIEAEHFQLQRQGVPGESLCVGVINAVRGPHLSKCFVDGKLASG